MSIEQRRTRQRKPSSRGFSAPFLFQSSDHSRYTSKPDRPDVVCGMAVYRPEWFVGMENEAVRGSLLFEVQNLRLR